LISVERILKTTRVQVVADTPDSLRGWLVALCAFIAGFVVFGVMYSFGVFFTPMEAEFYASRTQTSVFFAITGMLFYFFGSITGRLSDRFGARPVILAGAAIMGAGLTLTALATQMWIGYLTYGAGVGIGASCVYIPTLALVGGWFTRHRTTALGLAAAGTGCGTLLMPPVAAVLIEMHGWRTAYALFGASSFVMLLLSAALARQPPLAQACQMTKLSHVVRSRPFALLYASWVLATTGLIVAMVFLAPFAQTIGASPIAGSALISVIGGMSILGRGGIGFITRKARLNAAIQNFRVGDGSKLPAMDSVFHLWVAAGFRRNARTWLRSADCTDASGVDRVLRAWEHRCGAGCILYSIRPFRCVRSADRRLDHRPDWQLQMGGVYSPL
jgi:MFS family permease